MNTIFAKNVLDGFSANILVGKECRDTIEIDPHKLDPISKTIRDHSQKTLKSKRLMFYARKFMKKTKSRNC